MSESPSAPLPCGNAHNGRVVFISGIDTDTGKTFACGLLLRYLYRHNASVCSVKLVQTGCVGASEDLLMHRKIAGMPLLEVDRARLTAPQIFEFPASPLYAAGREGKTVDVGRITECVDALTQQFDWVIVEGAGGLCVPLTESLLTVDYVRERTWPLILVSSGKLGSLNHTLLALEAVERRAILLQGVLYNTLPCADKEIDADSFAYLKKYLAVRAPHAVLERIPYFDVNTPPDLDFSTLLGIE